MRAGRILGFGLGLLEQNGWILNQPEGEITENEWWTCWRQAKTSGKNDGQRPARDGQRPARDRRRAWHEKGRAGHMIDKNKFMEGGGIPKNSIKSIIGGKKRLVYKINSWFLL